METAYNITKDLAAFTAEIVGCKPDYVRKVMRGEYGEFTPMVDRIIDVYMTELEERREKLKAKGVTVAYHMNKRA